MYDLNFELMKILNVKGVQIISKTTQKSIHGGEPDNPFPRYLCSKLWCELPNGLHVICNDCINSTLEFLP